MATRRKPQQYGDDLTNGTHSPPVMPLQTSPAARSPFLPTRLEALLISIYPSTLLLGSIFSTLSSSTRNVPYSATSQSHPPEFAPSYFAHKKNIFNIYFVKVGWFWTTLAFSIFILLNPDFGRGLSRRRIQALFRYLSVTFWWMCMTQWFFGAPLIDQYFRFTGGQCQLMRDPEARKQMGDKTEYFTAAACKAVGGSWKGGHDISGHVFLLILGSALLWFEILPALTRAEGLRDGRKITLDDGKIASVAVEKQRGLSGLGVDMKNEDGTTRKGVKLAIGVMALMWWMLLMTAAYFHTWFEKFTGLAMAFAWLWGVYFLPRGVPALRAVLGMPGV
ncbi:hypothetical protein GQ43DRAFT_443588 [Delitschia confertaspora ATCC 74209]|uniref:Acyl-coenzyme A diphosphatase SCS3 n=1 Tax=Delitschia confertaspora ATCC 74209 TaxID=1513339 RepID=A0A9P4MVN4_9PLEO|nr:hypothetical protein GQ43DRAFT_443588 [Delitschia confertaspora ATCC 74209]